MNLSVWQGRYSNHTTDLLLQLSKLILSNCKEFFFHFKLRRIRSKLTFLNESHLVVFTDFKKEEEEEINVTISDKS